MKLTTAILLGMMAGSAWAQNPDMIQNARDTMHAVEKKKELDSNAALAVSQQPSGTVATPAPVAATGKASMAAPTPTKRAASGKPASAVHVTAVKAAATPKPTAKKKVAAVAK